MAGSGGQREGCVVIYYNYIFDFLTSWLAVKMSPSLFPFGFSLEYIISNDWPSCLAIGKLFFLGEEMASGIREGCFFKKLSSLSLLFIWVATALKWAAHYIQLQCLMSS